ncbi:MAG: hypothetical protein OXR66_01575 [Candidatus Woesearchaeota archaeon]|nr:hypothetical protein [Candidatus Woesearchaeota archaeon]
MKRGMEFAVGTLVVLILGLVIVGGGIVLVWNLAAESEQLAGDLTASQKEQLATMFTQGQLVAVYPGNVEARVNSDIVVGLGIENRMDDETFTIVVEVLDENHVVQAWQKAHVPTIAVGKNEHVVTPLALRVGSIPGTYTVLVSAMYGTELYDSKRFFTVNVR